jgi:ribosome-dependent ATPase
MFTISRGVFNKALGCKTCSPSSGPLLLAPVIIGPAIALLRKQES